MTIRPMTKPEMMYSYTQSQQIRSQTGNIGYLRADMDTNGKGFFSTWNGFRDDLKIQAFKDEFDAVINELRFGEGPEFFLKDRTSLAKYCFSHPEAAINDREFGVRVDTQNYAWIDGNEEPVPGMIIFFDWDDPDGSAGPQDGWADHTGIVERVENGIVYTVEGNSGDNCRENHYPVGHYEILGYGVPAY